MALQGAVSSGSGSPNSLTQNSGRTQMDAHQKHIEQTPQGKSGPLDTTTGGAPAASPQGQTPPGMQAAPEGSREIIVDHKNK